MDATIESEVMAETPERAVPAGNPVAKPFDFRHPVFLSSGEWRKLRMAMEEFVESTGALLSTYLRLDFTLQLGKLDTLSFNEFTATLPSQTHLTLFKTDPLRGISLMEIRPGIGQAIVDRLLGGPGKPSGSDRNLTDMEVALMDQFVQHVLDEWCKQWGKVQTLQAEIIAHETNPKFLQCTAGDTVMLVLTLEARMGECEGQFQLAFPYSTLEPLVNKLTQLGAAPVPHSAAVSTSAPKWTQHLDKVPMQMNARWPAMKVPTRKLMELQVGSVLELKAEEIEKLELQVGKVVKFRGRLGTRDKKWAIQITEVCKV